MFRGKGSKIPTAPPPEPVAPFSVGQTTPYSDDVEYQVLSRSRTDYSDGDYRWYFRGTALVHLPQGASPNGPIDLVRNRHGEIEHFTIPYVKGFKTGLMVIDRSKDWRYEENGHSASYSLIVDRVEVV